MDMVSKLTLTAVLALGAATAAPSPAAAQSGYGGQSAQPTSPPADSGNQRRTRPAREAPVVAQDGVTQDGVVEFSAGNISEGVRPSVAAAQTALAAEGALDTAAVRSQLETAKAAIQNDDDRFIVGQLMLQLGVKMQQDGGDAATIEAIQADGLRLALDSNRLATEQRGTYWTFLGNMASQAENYPEATTAYQNALRYNPNNADAHIQLARAKFETGDTVGGYSEADAAIEAARASGTDVPPSWLSLPLNQALSARDNAKVIAYGPALVRASDDPEVWRQVLLGYAGTARLDDQGTLDTLRLLMDADALDGSTYGEYAELAARLGLIGEARTAINAAGASAIDPAMRSDIENRVEEDRSTLSSSASQARSAATGRIALNTADAYAGYGEYDPAIALYRLALEKGGDIDPGTVNLRLARALMNANQPDQAMAALQAVSGSRAGLAQFWEAWVEKQNGASASTAPAASSATTPDMPDDSAE